MASKYKSRILSQTSSKKGKIAEQTYLALTSGRRRSKQTTGAAETTSAFEGFVSFERVPRRSGSGGAVLPADGLLLVKTDVEPSAEAEFNVWYDEHLPQLLSVPGFLGARRFRAIAGEPKYLALDDVLDVGVLESPPYLDSWSPNL